MHLFLFSLFAYSLLVAARPAPREQIYGRKIPISLTRSTHAAFVDAEGVVKHALLKSQLTRTARKILRGFKAFKKNTGIVHPSDKGIHLELEKRAIGSLELNDSAGVLWQGEVEVGTPPVTYTVDFDTGSSDFFLPSVSCTSNCDGHKLYDPNASSTATKVGKTFSIGFGDGTSVSGDQYTDTVGLANGNLSATTQHVGAATLYSEGFNVSSFSPDGLMGMAFEQISTFPADPVFQTLVNQNKVSEAMFAFKITADDSELYLGGMNSSKFTGSVTRVNVTQVGFWQVNADSVNVGGDAVISNIDSVIDTGTTLVVGDPDAVKQFYAAIPGSADASQTVGDGFFTFPCDSTPDVSLSFGGKAFSIAPEIFNLGLVSAGSSDCVGGIAGISGMSFWIIGDTFLQNVYSVFDVGQKQVGFADLS